MEWLQFGGHNIVIGRSGETKDVGDYALNLQCSWRLTGPEGIITGSTDFFYPAGDPYNEPPDFNYHVQGSNRCDERMAAFFRECSSRFPVVTHVWADNVGSIRLHLTGGCALEVFPDDSLKDEHWRLFQPYTEELHFVLTGSGIEED